MRLFAARFYPLFGINNPKKFWLDFNQVLSAQHDLFNFDKANFTHVSPSFDSILNVFACVTLKAVSPQTEEVILCVFGWNVSVCPISRFFWVNSMMNLSISPIFLLLDIYLILTYTLLIFLFYHFVIGGDCESNLQQGSSTSIFTVRKQICSDNARWKGVSQRWFLKST